MLTEGPGKTREATALLSGAKNRLKPAYLGAAKQPRATIESFNFQVKVLTSKWIPHISGHRAEIIEDNQNEHPFCRVPFGEPHVGSNATASLWQCGVNLRAHGGLKRHQDFELVVKPLSPGGLTLCASLTYCGWRAWKGFSLPIPSQHRAKSPRLNGSGGAQRIGIPSAATSTRASSRYEEGRCEAASPLVSVC